jgi:competence protein ComEC
MSIGLIPPLLAIFQQVSLVSPVANFFAIPLVSFGVVPLTLLGSIPALDFCLYPAQWLMEMCFIGLRWLENSPMPVWTQHAPPTWSILLGSIGVVWILLPRGFPSRWLGWLMLLPMFLVTPKPPEPNTAKIQIFDVGQGLAVSVQTEKHALLFDAGPDFNSEANSGNRILIPALRGMGVAKLDTLVLSHNDNDHIGGATGILQGMPVAEILSSLAENHPLLAGKERHTTCQDGQKWEWEGVQFELLHPDNAWLETLNKRESSDNNHSCVLRVFTGNQQLLLTGDAEAISEQNMLALHTEKLPSTIVVVPHHGSKSSSSEEFVAATQPKFAIFSVGYLNHFGHPKAEIVERYQAIGSQILRTDQTGAIEILMTTDGLTIERYRDSHRRYWQ